MIPDLNAFHSVDETVQTGQEAIQLNEEADEFWKTCHGQMQSWKHSTKTCKSSFEGFNRKKKRIHYKCNYIFFVFKSSLSSGHHIRYKYDLSKLLFVYLVLGFIEDLKDLKILNIVS